MEQDRKSEGEEEEEEQEERENEDNNDGKRRPMMGWKRMRIWILQTFVFPEKEWFRMKQKNNKKENKWIKNK